MKTIPDIVREIAHPAPHSSRVGIAMLLLAVRMIYGGDYA